MSYNFGANRQPGAGMPQVSNAGVPSNGTSEVQTLSITGTPTGGTFRLEFEGFVTAPIAHNAAAAAVVSALEALPSIGTGGVTATGGALPGTPVAITFAGNRARQAVGMITVAANNLTGGTSPAPAIAETTPGVNATARGAPKGTTLVDTTNGTLYINSGTPTAPTWTQVS